MIYSEQYLMNVIKTYATHVPVLYDNAACGDPECCGDYMEEVVCKICNGWDYPCDIIKNLNKQFGEENE